MLSNGNLFSLQIANPASAPLRNYDKYGSDLRYKIAGTVGVSFNLKKWTLKLTFLFSFLLPFLGSGFFSVINCNFVHFLQGSQVSWVHCSEERVFFGCSAGHIFSSKQIGGGAASAFFFSIIQSYSQKIPCTDSCIRV